MKILALIQVSRDLIPAEIMIFLKFQIFENSFGRMMSPIKTQSKNLKFLSFSLCSEANGIHLYIYIYNKLYLAERNIHFFVHL